MRRLTNLFRESASLTQIEKSSEKLLNPSLAGTGLEGGTQVRGVGCLVHDHFTRGILVLREKAGMALHEYLGNIKCQSGLQHAARFPPSLLRLKSKSKGHNKD